ncbi:hypothetical protein LJC60_07195 [Ruminococcaceae bacterium OttesenSCG-928-D13]|nr:hypothetical protein [Ruminococcaceae bacterium OttesenSCG-928-D13]
MNGIVGRVVLLVGLFALAAFCIVMGIKSRPHKLKKEPLQITFEKNLPHELGEPLAVLNSTKSQLVAALIWAAILVLVITMLINGRGSVIYLIPAGFGAGYNFWLFTRKLLLYENAVVVQSLTGPKVYYLDEIDCLVSYNIVNAFNRGVSYGFRLQKNGNVLTSFPKGSYQQLDRIEEVYRSSPYVSSINQSEIAL